MIQQTKYFKNLYQDGKNIFSYNTNVAIIKHDIKTIFVPIHYSSTTSKHINYIASLYNYKVIKQY